MSNNTPKFPSVYKRPTGFTKPMEAGVLAKAERASITAEMVRAVIEGSDVLDEGKSPAEAFLETIPSVPVMNVWWALEKKEAAARALEELGADAVQEGSDVAKAAARLRQRYVYCAMRNEVWDRRAGDWITIPALDNVEAVNMPRNSEGRVIGAWNILRNDQDADRVHNERYMPGIDQEIATEGGVQWLNLWKAPTLKARKGDAQIMLDHIVYLCNGSWELANHLLDWLAYCYQNPGKKINHALLIISAHHGVGKDTLGDALMRLLGEDNIALVQDEAVGEGRFHFMKRAQMVVVPEIMSGDRKDIANKLKPLITQNRIEINEKHVRPYSVQNVANFLMFSNHENAAHIEDHDRRYWVVICRQQPQSVEYYNELHAYIQGPAMAGFAHFLKTRDLAHFNPKAPAPWTADKKVVQMATRGGWEAWLDDAYESQAGPFYKHVLNLREALGHISQTDGAPKMTIQQLSTFLKDKKGAVDLGGQRVGQGGKQVRVWAIRDAEAIAKLPVSSLRGLYEGKMLSVVQGDAEAA